MTTEQAREAVDVLKLYDVVHSNTEGHRFEAHYDAINAVFDAGVASGIRQAREAVLSKDELYDEGADMWTAVTAIEALGGE